MIILIIISELNIFSLRLHHFWVYIYTAVLLFYDLLYTSLKFITHSRMILYYEVLKKEKRWEFITTRFSLLFQYRTGT